MANNGFFCSDGYLKRTERLSDQELGRLFRACMVYHATGEVTELTGRESVAFDFIREDIDAANEKYAAKCEKNRENIQKRWDDTNVYDRIRTDTNEYGAIPTDTNEAKVKVKVKVKNNKDDDDDDDDDSIARAREEADLREAIRRAVDLHCGRKATPAEVQQISLRARLARQAPEMASLAVQKAASNGARNLVKYVARIFDEWNYHEVKTPEEAEEFQVMYDESNGNGPWLTDSVEAYTQMEEARERRRQEHGSGAAGA